MYLRLIVVILFLCFPGAANSQEEVSDAEKLQEALAALEAMEKEKNALQAQLQPPIDPKARAVIDAYNESWVEFFDHQQALRRHAILALQWQLITAYCLTVLVLGLVGLGIYLSIIEVKAALRKPTDVEQKILAQDPQSSVREKIELTLSLQKLQVTSAVTGVVILVLSLAFLYLFVKEVFEINPQNFSAQAIPETLPEDKRGADPSGSEMSAP